MTEVIARQFLHSCKINKLPDGGNAVVVSEIQHYNDGTHKTVLVPYKNPKRSFWITKPQHRTYTEKKEFEYIDRLDKYTVHDYEMNNEIFRILNGYYPQRYIGRREIFESPYIYGANVDVQSLIKASYRDKFSKTENAKPLLPTTGFFDIEASVLQDSFGTVNLISVTHENKVYTAIHEAFFYKEENGKKIKGTIEEISQLSLSILTPLIEQMFSEHEQLKKLKDKLPFEFHYFTANDEVSLLRWIMEKVHENRTNFLGIWNLGYDIPALLEMLKKYNVDPADIFCPKHIPPQYRYFNYVHDTKKKAHFTDAWHWVHSASYGQFYDAMCLYAKLRTVNGKLASVKLNNILKDNKLEGKLHFPELSELQNLSEIDWHRHMQAHEFFRYIVYNQADVIWIQLMEWVNNDASSMLILSENSHLSKFPRQTVKFCETLYDNWVSKGHILGVSSSNMEGEFDDETEAIGGAVLDPNRIDQAGLACLQELPNFTTNLYGHNNDIDFSGMYPICAMKGNISKETKLSSVIHIRSPYLQKHYSSEEAVEVFFSYIASPENNAVALGTEFFNLPNFQEIEQLFAKEIENQREGP